MKYTDIYRKTIRVKFFKSTPSIVYKIEKFMEEVALDRPLTDYFINSTYNTYKTDHQLTGESSSKINSLSL
jgi:hypothetical protein